MFFYPGNNCLLGIFFLMQVKHFILQCFSVYMALYSYNLFTAEALIPGFDGSSVPGFMQGF